ncbi:MAG TPA: hypothetical protein VI248_13460 [Kineosporiaceae bacterium]
MLQPHDVLDPPARSAIRLSCTRSACPAGDPLVLHDDSNLQSSVHRPKFDDQREKTLTRHVLRGDSDIADLLASPISGYLTLDQEDGVTIYRLFHDALRTTLRTRWRDL